MAARDHVSPDQLRMFIPAGELADPSKYEHYDVKFGIGETHGSVQKRKLAEASTGMAWNARITERSGEPTLRASIEKHGVLDPVNVFPAPPKLSGHEYTRKPMLGNGHHRVFVANDVDPKTEVPVVWRE